MEWGWACSSNCSFRGKSEQKAQALEVSPQPKLQFYTTPSQQGVICHVSVSDAVSPPGKEEIGGGAAAKPLTFFTLAQSVSTSFTTSVP